MKQLVIPLAWLRKDEGELREAKLRLVVEQAKEKAGLKAFQYSSEDTEFEEEVLQRDLQLIHSQIKCFDFSAYFMKK